MKHAGLRLRLTEESRIMCDKSDLSDWLYSSEERL